MSLRKFGITTNIEGDIGGILINSVSVTNNGGIAQARDEKGRLIDIAVYSGQKEINIDGVYQSELVSPGTVITIDNDYYIVTSTSRVEQNRAFQNASLRAVSYNQYVPPVEKIPFTIKCTYPYGTSYVSLSSVGAPDPIILKAKINDGEWNTIQLDQSGSSYDVTLQDGDTIAFSGTNDHFSKDRSNYYRFGIGGRFEVSGNIMSLMNFSDSCTNNCFYRLFYNCKDLSSVPKNMLPATNLASGCYQNMFEYCDHLTDAPDLPATNLAPSCYYQMFERCTSLTSSPQLPATTLADFCYYNMFYECTRLSSAPQLPATTIARSCYKSMFYGCTRLSSAPDLPASTLYGACYNSMFRGCIRLTHAPQLPATTLTGSCYNSMFYNCTSLTTAPQLPATGLASYCYDSMFYGCTSLTSFPDLPATTLAKGCYHGMFWGCSAVVNPPKISATILAEYDQYGCMQNMFNNCSSLISIYLPATTLTNGCYTSMFAGCRSLTSITVDFTEWNNTQIWTIDVAPTGIFYKPSALPEIYGDSRIPTNWTVINR